MISTIVGLLIAGLFMAGFNYLALPAWNIHDGMLWAMLFCCILVFGAVKGLAAFLSDDDKFENVKQISAVGVVIAAVACIIVNASSSILLNRNTFATMLETSGNYKECTLEDFQNDFPETETISDISLMDSTAASIIGARTLGQLSDVVSQYADSGNYTTICYNGVPMKISPLVYAGFFQWCNNHNAGIPGYILVDPVKQTAEYVKATLKYSESERFANNIVRHIRNAYPTKLLWQGRWLEISDDGTPYYIQPTYECHAGLFGAKTINGAIICNATDGTCNYYNVKDIPTWVDNIYSSGLLSNMYNLKGKYSSGYFNFSNAGRTRMTDDFGLVAKDDDIWLFTGITSYVDDGSDESNIAFVLINKRTCETKYYKIPGAEEYSAMSAAEGQVANYGYVASFPSLVNIAGEPTYVMVLHDNAYLTKGYALVNMTQYSIVGTGVTQKAAIEAYKAALRGDSVQTQFTTTSPQSAAEITDTQQEQKNTTDWSTLSFTVTKIVTAETDGNTYYYLFAEQGKAYETKFSENKNVMMVSVGDSVTVLTDTTSSEAIVPAVLQ